MRNLMKTHDLKCLKEGSSFALERFYQRYHRMLFWFGKEMINDDFVVENLVQDCFLKLWQQREKIESTKHIFFFLRLVMKRECITYYTRPHNQFHRSIHRLEYYDNYDDYLLKDDLTKDKKHHKDQELAQQAIEKVERILPLLSTKQQRLIKLCLKFGFEYKAIAQPMGSSVTKIYNEVQQAIDVIKKIIHQSDLLKTSSSIRHSYSIQEDITESQAKVFQLRCEQKLSFNEIAEKLGQHPKEVYQNFSIAYQYLQQQHKDQKKTV